MENQKIIRPARSSWRIIATLIFLFIFPQTASSLTVTAGYDIFRTTGAGKDFSKTPIPGGFFDPGSKDFSGLMVLEGLPITEFMGITLPTPSASAPENQVDTIIHRLSDAVLGPIGSTSTIPVQMVALSLRSTTPIEIENSSQMIELWDVIINAPRNPVNSMVISLDYATGGTYDAIIPVDGIFYFTRRSDHAVRVLDAAMVGFPTLLFEIDNARWASFPVEPAPSGNFLVTDIDGLTSNFVPGYSSASGRENVCGINASIASHVRGDGDGWHGHVVTSPTPDNFFESDFCRTFTVVEPSTWELLVVGVAMFTLQRRVKIKQSARRIIRASTAIPRG